MNDKNFISVKKALKPARGIFTSKGRSKEGDF